MIDALVDMNLFAELLGVGTLGLVSGVLFPWLLRLIGYAVDVVFVVLFDS